jgi:hypothetical protein
MVDTTVVCVAASHRARAWRTSLIVIVSHLRLTPPPPNNDDDSSSSSSSSSSSNNNNNTESIRKNVRYVPSICLSWPFPVPALTRRDPPSLTASLKFLFSSHSLICPNAYSYKISAENYRRIKSSGPNLANFGPSPHCNLLVEEHVWWFLKNRAQNANSVTLRPKLFLGTIADIISMYVYWTQFATIALQLACA